MCWEQEAQVERKTNLRTRKAGWNDYMLLCWFEQSMKDAVSFICSLDKYSLDIRYAPNAVLGAGLRASPWHLAGAGDGGTGRRPSPFETQPGQ